MKLQDIFTQLTCGEFSQISIGGLQPGIIDEGNYKHLVAFINLGLTKLYQRFALKEGRITLELKPSLATYALRSQFGVASRRSREPVRYILDMDDPFQDDIHKIERILTMDKKEMPLNDRDNEYSCFTPSMNTLIVPQSILAPTTDTPEWLVTPTIDVYYRANHPIITIPIGPFDPNRIDIELPYSHLEALLYFVAARAHNPVGMTNEFHTGNTYAAKFEGICAELERNNIRIDQGAQVNRLRQKGFV